MASGNIKGITIQFRGETTELDEALRKINKETKSIDDELRNVNRALKFNPTSVELWRQKQTLLNQKLSETKEKASVLRDTLKKVDSGEIEMSADDVSKLKRELIEADSKAKKFQTELDKIGNANLKAVSEQLKQVGDKMVNVGQTMTTKVTAPIVAGYTVAAKYASDYEENLNKLDVAFGSNSQAVKDWANAARTEFGLSKVQATDAASAFGALGKGIGLSESEAADMSTTLAGLSADLGSYFNVGVAESSKALEGIFTGESEALKKFGVVMTDTNLQKFASDQGLVWKELDQSEKTMLRYQYVLEQTKDAQGDFARTSDGTANSTKIFQASLQDLGTSIGTTLLPIITPIIQKITEWINKFNELSPSTQKIITIVGLVVAAIGPLLIIVGTLISSIGAIIGAAPAIVTAMGTFITGAAPVIAIIGALIAIGVLLYKNWDTIKAYAINLWNTLKTTFNGIKTSVITTWNNIKSSVTNTVNNLKTGITTAWNAIKTAVSTAVNGLKTVITTIWNAIKTYITNGVNGWKSILSGAWDSIKSTASNAWNAVKNAIIDPIKNAWKTVKTWIDKLKDLFPLKVGKIFSNLKIPHIKINGGKAPFGIGGKGEAPKISVDWYRKAMNNPYMFSTPTLFGAGEAGDEMLYGRAALMRDISEAVSRGGQSEAPNITININGATADPREIADEVRRMLIQEANRRRLAW